MRDDPLFVDIQRPCISTGAVYHVLSHQVRSFEMRITQVLSQTFFVRVGFEPQTVVQAVCSRIATCNIKKKSDP